MNILIIEDEQAAAQRLHKLITRIKPDINLLATLDSVESTIQWLEENKDTQIDLALVDIQLGDGTSFEVFEAVDISFPVVFTTAYDSYALEAFKVHAIDYILKPVKQQDLEDALEKYDRLDMGDRQNVRALIKQMQGTQFKHRFVTKVGRTIKILHVDAIAYFMTELKISFAVMSDGKRYPVEYSLDQLDQILDPNTFYRANRQFIINIKAIKELHSYSKARLKVSLVPPPDQDVIVSTERSSRFKQWLAGE